MTPVAGIKGLLICTAELLTILLFYGLLEEKELCLPDTLKDPGNIYTIFDCVQRLRPFDGFAELIQFICCKWPIQ
jgi:hypothetical protein